VLRIQKSFFFAKSIKFFQCIFGISALVLATTHRANLALVNPTFSRRISAKNPIPFPIKKDQNVICSIFRCWNSNEYSKFVHIENLLPPCWWGWCALTQEKMITSFSRPWKPSCYHSLLLMEDKINSLQ
jgi:hypothetical protein